MSSSSRPATRGTQDTLWTLIAAPTIWALHFLASYVSAAYVCAPNAAIFQTILATRFVIAGLTLVALVAIGLILRRALREWQAHGGDRRNDEDTPTARESFLEFSTVLLAALSLVGVIFVALPALFNVDCR